MEILTNRGEIHFSIIALDRERVKDIGFSFSFFFQGWGRGERGVSDVQECMNIVWMLKIIMCSILWLKYSGVGSIQSYRQANHLTCIPIISFLVPSKWGHYTAAFSHVKPVSSCAITHKGKEPQTSKKQRTKPWEGNPMRKNCPVKVSIGRPADLKNSFLW